MNFEEIFKVAKDFLPGAIDIIKPKKKDSEMCEIHIVGTESMILKIFGYSGEEERRASYCG